jgi:hypothetical protein
MKILRPYILLTALVALTLVGSGCSEHISAPDSNPTDAPAPLAFTTLPTGSPLESATLHLYVFESSGQDVQLHAVNEAWDEMGATWNNFGGGFDADPALVFTAATVGWVSVDITALATEWMRGARPNQGIILLQDDPGIPRSVFTSRERGDFEPYIELLTSGGGEELLPVADVFLSETDPDTNWGDIDKLYTGRHGADLLEKRSLLRFELPDLPEDPDDSVCTRGRRWWKRHTGHGNRPDEVSSHLPLSVGDLGIDDADGARQVLRRRADGCQINGLTRMASQLLAAKLNVAAGADDADIAATILEADAFLSDHEFGDWRQLSRPEKQQVRGWKRMLRQYNRGVIGPGSCSGC